MTVRQTWPASAPTVSLDSRPADGVVRVRQLAAIPAPLTADERLATIEEAIAELHALTDEVLTIVRDLAARPATTRQG